MQFSTLFFLAAVPSALAQYGGGDYGGSDSSSTAAAPADLAAATSTASSSGPVHTVKVGDGGLNFNPNSFNAVVGDTVEFHFYPQKHSVARGNFATPCTPSNDTFYSGAFPVSSGTASEVFTITVNDTKPIWFYCGVPSHCEAGMAGVVNPPSDGSKTIEMYQAAAKNVTETVSPTVVQGGVVHAAGSSASETASGTSSSTSSSQSAKSTNAASKGSIAWTGLAAGVAVVGFSGLMI